MIKVFIQNDDAVIIQYVKRDVSILEPFVHLLTNAEKQEIQINLLTADQELFEGEEPQLLMHSSQQQIQGQNLYVSIRRKAKAENQNVFVQPLLHLFSIGEITLLSTLSFSERIRLPFGVSSLKCAKIPAAGRVFIKKLPKCQLAGLLNAADLMVRNPDCSPEQVFSALKFGYFSGFESQNSGQQQFCVQEIQNRLQVQMNKTNNLMMRQLLCQIIPKVQYLQFFAVHPHQTFHSLMIPEYAEVILLEEKESSSLDFAQGGTTYHIQFRTMKGSFSQACLLPAKLQVSDFGVYAKIIQTRLGLSNQYQLLDESFRQLSALQDLPIEMTYIELRPQQDCFVQSFFVLPENMTVLAQFNVLGVGQSKPTPEFVHGNTFVNGSEILVKQTAPFHPDLFNYSLFSITQVECHLRKIRRARIRTTKMTKQPRSKRSQKSDVYEVEYIVARKPYVAKSKVSIFYPNLQSQQFLVHWAGYSNDQRTWEPEWNIPSDCVAVEAFNIMFGNVDNPISNGILDSKDQDQAIQDMLNIIDTLLDDPQRAKETNESSDSKTEK